MATKETVGKIFAMVFFKFPNRNPATQEGFDLAFDVWERIFEPISDDLLLRAGQRFVAEKTGIFPNEDPFAMILEMARPRQIETQGDAFELALESVRLFGHMREDEALKWLESKSPIIAATVRRFGFRELCTSENLEVVRGQMMAIFKAEKERATKYGEVIPSAVDLQKGNFPALPCPANVLKLDSLVDGLSKKLSLGKKAA